MSGDAPWARAVDLQLGLIRWWRTPPPSVRPSADVPINALEEAIGASLFLGWGESSPGFREQVETHLQVMAHSLEHASTYWVGEEMGRFLFHAQGDYPDSPLDWSEVPQPNGFVVFDSPLSFDVFAGQDFSMIVDPFSPTEAVVIKAVQWASMSVSSDPSVSDPNTDASLFLTLYGADMRPVARSLISLGAPPIDTAMRLMAAFFALTRQTITSVRRESVGRAVRRRAQRAGILDLADRLRVVTLRRIAADTDSISLEDRRVAWSHRWIVGGHWRQQWYPSSHAHRPVWIAPHVKGPESAPLVVKDRVYRLIR